MFASLKGHLKQRGFLCGRGHAVRVCDEPFLYQYVQLDRDEDGFRVLVDIGYGNAYHDYGCSLLSLGDDLHRDRIEYPEYNARSQWLWLADQKEQLWQSFEEVAIPWYEHWCQSARLIEYYRFREGESVPLEQEFLALPEPHNRRWRGAGLENLFHLYGHLGRVREARGRLEALIAFHEEQGTDVKKMFPWHLDALEDVKREVYRQAKLPELFRQEYGK